MRGEERRGGRRQRRRRWEDADARSGGRCCGRRTRSAAEAATAGVDGGGAEHVAVVGARRRGAVAVPKERGAGVREGGHSDSGKRRRRRRWWRQRRRRRRGRQTGRATTTGRGERGSAGGAPLTQLEPPPRAPPPTPPFAPLPTGGTRRRPLPMARWPPTGASGSARVGTSTTRSPLPGWGPLRGRYGVGRGRVSLPLQDSNISVAKAQSPDIGLEEEKIWGPRLAHHLNWGADGLAQPPPAPPPLNGWRRETPPESSRLGLHVKKNILVRWVAFVFSYRCEPWGGGTAVFRVQEE